MDFQLHLYGQFLAQWQQEYEARVRAFEIQKQEIAKLEREGECGEAEIGNMQVGEERKRKARHKADADKAAETRALPRREDRSSSFFITIGPNFVPQSEQEAKDRAAEFKTVLDDMFSDAGMQTVPYIEFGKFSRAYERDTVKDNIKQKSYSASLEIGEKMGRLHAHVLLELRHDSNVFINAREIAAHVKEKMNKIAEDKQERPFFTGKSIYTNIRLLSQPSAATQVKKYIRKTVVVGPSSADKS